MQTQTGQERRRRAPKAASERAALIEQDPRWAALVARDAAADGTFFYSVETTGVYCRPSCAARTPRPENVAFYLTRGAAEGAGFRPCKRCKPDQPPLADRQRATVEQVCRLIDAAEEIPTLEELASEVGVSAYHLHRLFKRVTGLTPPAYARAKRAGRLRAGLDTSRSVTEAIYGAGYASGGRFYEEADQVLGMTPTQYRAGGAGTTIRFAVGACSFGDILVGATPRGVCAVLLDNDAEALVEELERRFPHATLLGGDAEFERLVARVVALVEAPASARDLPLDLGGTAFQERVWRALCKVPPGTTTTYSDLARAIGAPSAARAVAQACAANPLAVVIPCHRVVRRDGGLGGYRWGIERKRELLAREARV